MTPGSRRSGSSTPAPTLSLREIIAAWREASARGSALVVIGGKLVENLHVAEAERLLAVAEAVAEMGW